MSFLVKLQKDPSPAADSRQDRAVRSGSWAAKISRGGGSSPRAHFALWGSGFGLPYAGLFLALGARRTAAVAAIAVMLAARRALAALRCGLGAFDGQCNFAVRCNRNHLDGNSLPIAEHRGKILYELVGNLGDVDKTSLTLRQRNERAERLDTSDLALDNIPNL